MYRIWSSYVLASRSFSVPAMGNGVLSRKVPVSRVACVWALMMRKIFVFSIGVGFFMLIA